ncbi:MAG TPA: hypothetical protein VFJ28_04670 [Marmoricola sp.]|nr:hypothetical protein [Marmoricola sp.]
MTVVTGAEVGTVERSAPRRRQRRLPLHAVLLLPGAVALLAGIDAALLLMEVPAPVSTERLPVVHGPLMVLGFLGTLVSLERAVALRRRVGFLAPALLGSGGVLLLSPAPLPIGQWLLVGGAGALALTYVPLWRRQRDDAVLVQALGAVAAGGGALLWTAGLGVPDLLPWLCGFVVLTIAGERLELARFAMGPSAGTVLVLAASAYAGCLVATLLWPAVGHPLLGVVVLGLVGWLFTHDVARRTVRSTGLARFAAVGMLAGYGWLVVAGALWLVGTPTGAAYDAVVHAVFLGFTMSMVMAHAPVILPAVLRQPLPWHPAMYGPLVLLHASLALRLWVGDALGSSAAWRTGGVLNIVALLSFVAVAVWVSRRGRRP